MICRECKKEINDDIHCCPYCGCIADKNNDYPKTGIVVLSFLLPVIGIIAGIKNIISKKKDSGQSYLLAGIFTLSVCALLLISSL